MRVGTVSGQWAAVQTGADPSGCAPLLQHLPWRLAVSAAVPEPLLNGPARCVHAGGGWGGWGGGGGGGGNAGSPTQPQVSVREVDCNDDEERRARRKKKAGKSSSRRLAPAPA